MPAYLKRKRPHEGPEPSVVNTATTAPALQRRATRQSSIPPLPAPQDPEPRRRRRRADANGEPTEHLQTTRSPRGKENMLVHSEQQQRAQQPPKQSTRSTRHSASRKSPPAPRPSRPNISHTQPGASPASVQTIPMIVSDAQRPTAVSRPAPPTPAAAPGRHGPRSSMVDSFVPHQQSVSLGRNKPIIMKTSVSQPGQNLASRPNGTSNGAASGADNTTRPDRNIDKVVLGDICFRAWYPSYYGKEVLGDISGNSSKGGNDVKNHSSTGGGGGIAGNQHQDGKDETNGAKTHGRRDRDHHPPMLDRLYVCPCCFKYSRELVTWWEHVRWCERRGYMPGRQIYTHPRGKRTVLVPAGPAPRPGRGNKRGSVGQRLVEQVVQDEGEWSIREVDGEEDVLFCQNLSLFAKLFLDNKSVFFDVTGFNYFLLVYTPPPPAAAPPTASSITTNTETTITTRTPKTPTISRGRSQIVGFFSKEKMSWDNNNLACILVFPPWQRKGLGSLLMGVSYEISRREGVLGGPEKPISDLGKKGYKRFWAGEICRWILGLAHNCPNATSDGDPCDGDDEGDNDGAMAEEKKEIVVDVEACSQATWIAPEDCLSVLREMGLAEDAGAGPPLRASKAQASAAKKADEGANTNGPGTAVTAETTSPMAPDQTVPRVRISQAAVRTWVITNKISLERACDPDGFVEGYALKGRAAQSEEPV
ncbi:histone acetyltransferase-like protein [Corynascus similis CBS 632.67]